MLRQSKKPISSSLSRASLRFGNSPSVISDTWTCGSSGVVGELDATFDVETAKTTLDWEEGVNDENLSINIYRYESEVDIIDPNSIVATVDASLSSFEIEVPQGEHRQSIYAITLQDALGNELTQLTGLSPVSDYVLETTISTSTVTSISKEDKLASTVATIEFGSIISTSDSYL